MAFTSEEVERYARHLVLADVGGPGQQRLRAATVTVVGCGGLGAPLIAYLAAAGIGRLRLVDDDTVARANLQRQVIFAEADIGTPKVAAAAAFVRRVNPGVTVDTHPVRATDATLPPLVAGATAIADGSDNAATRYAVADACTAAAVPLVTAAVEGFAGSVTTLAPHIAGNPSYRTLFPDPPDNPDRDVCAVTGILGVVTGVIGTLQANEVLKLVLGVGEPLIGRLLMFDARTSRFETVAY